MPNTNLPPEKWSRLAIQHLSEAIFQLLYVTVRVATASEKDVLAELEEVASRVLA